MHHIYYVPIASQDIVPSLKAFAALKEDPMSSLEWELHHAIMAIEKEREMIMMMRLWSFVWSLSDGVGLHGCALHIFTHRINMNQLPSALGASLTRAGHTMTTHCGHRLHRQTYSELFGAHLRFGLHSADVGWSTDRRRLKRCVEVTSWERAVARSPIWMLKPSDIFWRCLSLLA